MSPTNCAGVGFREESGQETEPVCSPSVLSANLSHCGVSCLVPHLDSVVFIGRDTPRWTFRAELSPGLSGTGNTDDGAKFKAT